MEEEKQNNKNNNNNDNNEFINLIDKLNKIPKASVYMLMTQMCILIQNLHNKGFCCFNTCVTIECFSLCKKTGELYFFGDYFTLFNDGIYNVEQKKTYDRKQLMKLFIQIGEKKGIDVTRILSALVIDNWNNVYSILANMAILDIEDVSEYSSRVMMNSLQTQNNILLGDENTPKYVTSFNGDHSFLNVFKVLQKTIKDINRNNRPSHIVFVYSDKVNGKGPITQVMNDFLLACVDRGILSAKIKTHCDNENFYYEGQKQQELIKPLLKRDSRDDAYLFDDQVNIYHVIGFSILYCLYHDISLSIVVPLDTYLLLCAEINTLSKREFIENFFRPHIMGNMDLEIGKQNIIDMMVGAVPIKNLIRHASCIGMNEEKLRSVCIESLCNRLNIYESKNKNIIECAKIDNNFNKIEREFIMEWLQSIMTKNDIQRQIMKIITGSETFSDFFILKNLDQNNNNNNNNGDIKIQVCSKIIILPQSLFRFDYQNNKNYFKNCMNTYFSFAWLNSSSSHSYVFNTT